MTFFIADDRAAALNGNSYQGISQDIRRVVNREFEEFILSHIRSRESFAIETTLRSRVTFEQVEMARSRGFRIEMRYLALQHFALHFNRVKARAFAGGHSASESTLRRIYGASLANLGYAIKRMDRIWVYDNSAVGLEPKLVLEAAEGNRLFVSEAPPDWLRGALDSRSSQA